MLLSFSPLTIKPLGVGRVELTSTNPMKKAINVSVVLVVRGCPTAFIGVVQTGMLATTQVVVFATRDSMLPCWKLIWRISDVEAT